MSEDNAHGSGEQQPESFPPVPKHRKKKHKHAAHGGAWKVAYADFITTMMALFLLLWLLSSADQASRQALSLFFRDPGIFDNPQGQNMVPGSGAAPKTRQAPIMEVSGSGGAGQRNTENTINMERMARALHERLAQTSSSRGVVRQVNMLSTKDGLQVQLSDSGETDLFETGTAVMKSHGMKMIRDMSEIIIAMTDYQISVDGHTDSKPPPNLKYNNRDLSADRAQRVMQLMVGYGVPADRFKVVAGYGDLYLIDPESPTSPLNRRIVLTLKSMKTVESYQGIPAVQPPPRIPIEQGEKSASRNGTRGGGPAAGPAQPVAPGEGSIPLSRGPAAPPAAGGGPGQGAPAAASSPAGHTPGGTAPAAPAAPGGGAAHEGGH